MVIESICKVCRESEILQANLHEVRSKIRERRQK